MKTLSALFSGALFGLGLALSGMTKPGKVVAFLDVFGAWDPSLALVMGAALAIFAPTFHAVTRRRARPLFGTEFDLPTRTEITPRLVVGAALFGVGWGLAGFCPGTAIATLPTGTTPVLILVAGVFIGILATWGTEAALSEKDVAVEADF